MLLTLCWWKVSSFDLNNCSHYAVFFDIILGCGQTVDILFLVCRKCVVHCCWYYEFWSLANKIIEFFFIL